MGNEEEVKAALQKLDPKNDNHWTADGMPRLESVRIFAGNSSLKREDLTRAAPEFSRSNPSVEPKAAEPASAAGPTDVNDQSGASGNGAGDAEGTVTTTSAEGVGNEATGDGSGTKLPPVTGEATQGTDGPAQTSGDGDPDTKKPNDLQSVYTRTEGIDSEGNVVGVQMPDLPSVAGQPGGTAPEHIAQVSTVEVMLPGADADQQADGSDGTSVVIHGLPSEGLTNDINDADAGENDLSQAESARDAGQKEVDELTAQIEDLTKQRSAKQLAVDDQVVLIEKLNGRNNSNQSAIRSYLDQQNQLRSEAGTRKQALMQSGFNVKDIMATADPRTPLDRSRTRKAGLDG